MLLALLLSAMTSGCASNAAKPAGAFDRYPRSPALDAIVRAHAEGERDREQWLVLTTWFRDGDPRVAMMSGVRPDGHVSTWRYVHAWAVQDSQKRDLVADQLAELQQALETMPPSQSPRMEDLLIVSVRRDGRWTTHLYDRERPPENIGRLFALTGAPIRMSQDR